MMNLANSNLNFRISMAQNLLWAFVGIPPLTACNAYAELEMVASYEYRIQSCFFIESDLCVILEYPDEEKTQLRVLNLNNGSQTSTFYSGEHPPTEILAASEDLIVLVDKTGKRIYYCDHLDEIKLLVKLEFYETSCATIHSGSNSLAIGSDAVPLTHSGAVDRGEMENVSIFRLNPSGPKYIYGLRGNEKVRSIRYANTPGRHTWFAISPRRPFSKEVTFKSWSPDTLEDDTQISLGEFSEIKQIIPSMRSDYCVIVERESGNLSSPVNVNDQWRVWIVDFGSVISSRQSVYAGSSRVNAIALDDERSLIAFVADNALLNIVKCDSRSVLSFPISNSDDCISLGFLRRPRTIAITTRHSGVKVYRYYYEGGG